MTKAKLCCDGRTYRNEVLIKDLVQALDIATKALCQYRDGKTWSHIAVDALAEVEEVIGENEREKSASR